MTHPPYTLILPAAIASLLIAQGCSDSSNGDAPATPTFEADTSYLDDMASDQGIPQANTDEPATDTPPSPAAEPDAEPENDYDDEEREWTAEPGSKSLLGRARDKGKNIRDRIQDSNQPDNGVAITYADEEYAQAAGFAWDMPKDWQMAVPSNGRFAEMFVEHQLGNALVAFTKETQSISKIKRSLESTITDTFSSRNSAKVTKKTVMNFQVTIFDLTGTYIDPGAKGTSNGSPFYAIHAAVVELPTTKVLIKLWGPQDTVEQNIGRFDAMIEKMYKK